MRVAPARRDLWLEIASNVTTMIAIIGVLVKQLPKTDNSFMVLLVVSMVLMLVFCLWRLARVMGAFMGYYHVDITNAHFSARVRIVQEAKTQHRGGEMIQQLSKNYPFHRVLSFLRSERRSFDIAHCKSFEWLSYHWRELNPEGCYFMCGGKQYVIVTYNKDQADQSYQALVRA